MLEKVASCIMQENLGSFCIHSAVPQLPGWEDVSLMRFVPFDEGSLWVDVYSLAGNFSVRIFKEKKEVAALIRLICGDVLEEEDFFVSAKEF
jgi:hypothetical protein